jgi:DNA repair exonuclease SbcCD ATPase subunit
MTMENDSKPSLAGDYVLLHWLIDGNVRHPPGTIVTLTHAEAVRLIAQGTVAVEAPTPAPTPSEQRQRDHEEEIAILEEQHAGLVKAHSDLQAAHEALQNEHASLQAEHAEQTAELDLVQEAHDALSSKSTPDKVR